ncbi:hypothetical protein PIB30_060600 [Stylosanthes scabra]|uniref:Uncharacterized protein n=1 Tax=Stylosanthes scabra TaxID=79078 RepID=A0ABU6RKT3_9FABA|nr:hypothetical protein [Stylosanthes scabra]
MAEVFKQTHTLKAKNEQFADKRMISPTTPTLPPSRLQSSELLQQWIPIMCGVRLYPSRITRTAYLALEVSSGPHSEPL